MSTHRILILPSSIHRTQRWLPSKDTSFGWWEKSQLLHTFITVPDPTNPNFSSKNLIRGGETRIVLALNSLQYLMPDPLITKKKSIKLFERTYQNSSKQKAWQWWWNVLPHLYSSSTCHQVGVLDHQRVTTMISSETRKPHLQVDATHPWWFSWGLHQRGIYKINKRVR